MMKKIRLSILAVLFFSVVRPATAADDGHSIGDIVGGMHEVASRSQKFFKSLGIAFGGDILKLKLFNDIAEIDTKYKLGVQPAYDGKLMERTDEYTLDTSLGALKPFEQITEQLGLNAAVDNNVDITFIRHFLNSHDAFFSWPYFLKNIPRNTDTVMNRMNVGDFVSIRSRLDFIISASFAQSAFGISSFGVDAGIHYLLRGQFTIQFLKVSDTSIKVRFIALREREIGLDGIWGFQDLIELTPVKIINDRVTALLDLNPIKVQIAHRKNKLFLADYLIDLSKAGEVYDQTFANRLEMTFKLKDVLKDAKNTADLSVIHPFTSDNGMAKALTIFSGPLDQYILAHADDSDMGVKDMLDAVGNGQVDLENTKLGVRVVKWTHNNSYIDEKVRINQQDDDTPEDKYYLYKSKQVDSDLNVLFSWFQIKKKSVMLGLFSTDTEFNNPDLNNLYFEDRKGDSHFSRSDIESYKKYLKFNLSPRYYNAIDFSGWHEDAVPKKNVVGIRKIISFNADAVKVIPKMSEDEIKKSYIDYLNSVTAFAGSHLSAGFEIPVSVVPCDLGWYGTDKNNPLMYYQTHFCASVDSISRSLAVVFSNRPGLKRVSALMSLRNNDLFRFTGPGYLISLLPYNDANKYVRVELVMTSAQGDKVIFPAKDSDPLAGPPLTSSFKNLYNDIQDTLNDDSFDLRQEAEALGFTFRQKLLERKIHPYIAEGPAEDTPEPAAPKPHS